MVDEAHRTQYGALAARMRAGLPNACMIAFTGTPIDKKDRSTREAFGDLEPGEVPEIVNDHDPVPLRNQLEHRNPGAFSWVYKETGPLWRVEIGRRKVHASDHECTCGNH